MSNLKRVGREELEIIRVLNLNIPRTKQVSNQEQEIFEAGLKFFDIGNYPVATECFAKLVLHRNDCGVYHINKLVSNFVEQRQLFPKLFLSQFSQLGKREKISTYQFDPLDKVLPYPTMVYNLCLLMRMISKESETILYVIERLQKAAMPSEIPDTLLVKTDLLAIDILIQENEFSIAYDEILRTEKEYEILEPYAVIKLQQFKARCMVALNHKNIKKEYKTLFALTKSHHPSYHVGSFIKAEHEYLMNNYIKALKTMDSFLNKYCEPELRAEFLKSTGDNIGMLIKNNQACCEFNFYKPATALWRLQEAHKEYSLHQENLLTYPAYCTSQVQQFHVLNYNEAIVLMYTQRYKEAIPLLLKSCRQFPFNPRIWLRLGQACLAVVNPIYEDMHVTPRKLIDGIGNEISSGTLNTVVYVDTVNDCIYERPRLKAKGLPGPKIIFTASNYAKICAIKALEMYRGYVEDGEGIKVCPSAPIYDRKSRSILRAEILSFLTHICSRFGAYKDAFAHATELLAIEHIPGQLRYMAKVDIGEAATKLKDARRAEPFIEEDDDIAEMLSRGICGPETPNEPSHHILKSYKERWCRNAFWLETHRACCQILYKTKTMYFYEALEQTRECMKKIGDELPIPLFTAAMFLFKFTGCLDEAKELWRSNIGQFYTKFRNIEIDRSFKKVSPIPQLPRKQKKSSTHRNCATNS